MSLLDRIAAAVMPPESAKDRESARSVILALSNGDDWLATIVDHHSRIESAFDTALAASDGPARQTAVRLLASLLTAHANAEETVIYPILADSGEKSHAVMAYEEQAMVKIELAKLEKLDPMGKEWREKLEHIRGAVLHHVYQEEKDWFPRLQGVVSPMDRAELDRRFRDEFDRYGLVESVLPGMPVRE